MNKEEIILGFMKDENYTPMKAKEISILLGVPKKEYNQFTQTLKDLEENYKIVKNKKNRYRLIGENFVEGTYRKNQKGFGFVKIENQEDEIYISKEDSLNALNGDKVLIEIIEEKSKDKRAEGKIKKIIKHEKDTVVGTFQKSQNFGFVVPDEKSFGTDIFISKNNIGKAKNGYKVVVQITKYPEKGKNAEGKIIEVLGSPDQAGVDMLSLIKEYNLPSTFPEQVVEEAKKYGDKIDEKDIPNRVDCRNHVIFTIDGEDAKDLDDAVRVTKLENGNYRLDVHIADVSHYVKEGSFLDKEAQIRGTSIYMLSRVIPMLPKELSNGICSLNAGEDRFTLSCSMEINPEGKTISTEVYKGIINVCERMNYHDVQKILDKSDKDVLKRYEKYVKDFELMAELATILKERRLKQGYLNLDIPESKIDLDEEGRVINVGKYETSFSNEIIEQFMLSANEAIAEKFYWLEAPFIYRVHEDPDLDKIKDLNKFLFNFGLKIKVVNEKVYPTEVSKILEEIKGKTFDFWDSSLVWLKNDGFAYGNQLLFDKRNFTKYINYFYLWDYVESVNGEYRVKPLFNSHSNIENGNVYNSLPWTNISNEQDLKQFLKNACENISKRGSFMSILMRLRSADNPKLKEISDEYFNIIQGDFLHNVHMDGYNDAVTILLRLLENFDDKNDKDYKLLYDGIMSLYKLNVNSDRESISKSAVHNFN